MALPLMNLEAPYLSIVLVGRNDNFGGDFNERFLRALRFNHQHLCRAGVDHEYVFVEWAPIEGQPYLADVIRGALPELSERLTAYIVDRRYHDVFSLNPAVKFMEFVAKNVGIRRAMGEYILSTNTDIFLSRSVIGALAVNQLEHGTLYRATRIDIKLGADLSHVDFSVLDDPRNHGRYKPIQPPLFTGGSGDFQLLDRASWHRLRGFNEVYRVAKIGIDANFCAKAYASGCRIQDIGAPVYHLSHVGSFRLSKGMYSAGGVDAPWGRRWNTQVVYDNPEAWGLEHAPTRSVAGGVHYLSYDLAAVPPLVDLRRVLKPVDVLTTLRGRAIKALRRRGKRR